MAVAVAASPAVYVSTLMLMQALAVACGLACKEPEPAVEATARGAVARECCAGSPAMDVHGAAVVRARDAARHGDWNEAAELWRDALLIDGRVAAHWVAMGDALLHAERHREAVAAYQRAIQLDARYVERGTRAVALAYARMGNDRQAVRWLEQALRLGARADELLSEGSFRRYRGEPRLLGATRRNVERRTGAAVDGVPAST